MRIDRLDHFVLTCRDVEATIRFYQSALGMEPVTFGAGRRALAYGRSKINLHDAKAPVSPHATHPVPGSADLCFIAEGTIDDVLASLPGVVTAGEEAARPEWSWRRGRARHEYWPDGAPARGDVVAPDLEDVVIALSLARRAVAS